MQPDLSGNPFLLVELVETNKKDWERKAEKAAKNIITTFGGILQNNFGCIFYFRDRERAVCTCNMLQSREFGHHKISVIIHIFQADF